MLERITIDGLTIYLSPLLRAIGVPHAFSTRLGGVSAAPFDSLNLGHAAPAVAAGTSDEAGNIRENYRRLQLGIGRPDARLVRVHQVHGRVVHHVVDPCIPQDSVQADAMITTHRDALLSVRVADCVPILLAGADGRTVAAVHAGWRGVVANIAEVAVAELCRIGQTAPENLTAAIGPCISREAFEVGPEVEREFLRAVGEQVVDRSGSSRPHVDLRAAVRLQFLAAGLPDDQIDTTDRCTSRDGCEFYSHRRDKGMTGRMAAVIGTRIRSRPGEPPRQAP